MPDLETHISEWRTQMLAAGIRPSATLNELENHLREEIERRIEAGADEEAAFAGAIMQLGHANTLKAEFQKNNSLSARLAEALLSNRVLGLGWLVFCLGGFYKTTNGLLSTQPHPQITSLFILAWLMDFVYLRGVIASVLWFGGIRRERHFIFFLALLDAIGGIAFLFCRAFQPLSVAFTIFGFVTLWRLWPRRMPTIATQ
ncbi:MAG TPA: hypothetical protein VGO57_10295 [Verrucomicrobiae bacterium]|jgi:hypothetical protein